MKVILVNQKDRKVGEEEKMNAHREGKLHRAFSVLVFNSKGEIILQKRALSKYHCGGLWTNTCCSHPFPGEKTKSAARRRLQEEMGFDTPLSKVFSFVYKSIVGDLVEYEFDHVFIGVYDGEVRLNRAEAEEISFMKMKDLKKDISDNPEKYTPWFRIIIEKYANKLKL